MFPVQIHPLLSQDTVGEINRLGGICLSDVTISTHIVWNKWAWLLF